MLRVHNFSTKVLSTHELYMMTDTELWTTQFYFRKTIPATTGIEPAY